MPRIDLFSLLLSSLFSPIFSSLIVCTFFIHLCHCRSLQPCLAVEEDKYKDNHPQLAVCVLILFAFSLLSSLFSIPSPSAMRPLHLLHIIFLLLPLLSAAAAEKTMGLMVFVYGKDRRMIQANAYDVRETIRSINANGARE